MSDLGSVKEAHLRQGASVGAVGVLFALAQQLGLIDAWARDQPRLVAAHRAGDRSGSRLCAVRLARHHGALEFLGLERFDEDLR